MDGQRVTIAIPAFNGQEFLDEVLVACLTQRTPFPYRVLVVDSGSTDETLEIVARHPDVALHRVPNSEFGHGRTRNLAATLAGGDIVVFLTQDATPIGPSWLVELVAPLASDPRLAGVFARQLPRPGHSPAASRDLSDLFRSPSPGFFSNVCSAVRRSVLAEVPFRDVDYAEDRAFARDAIAAGYHIAYAPAAQVRHSHDLALGAYFRRMYDEAKGVAAVGRAPRTGLVWLAAATARGTIKDWRFVAASPDYPRPTKLWWALRVPVYNVARRAAIWLAGRPLPDQFAAALSLERHRRRVAVG